MLISALSQVVLNSARLHILNLIIIDSLKKCYNFVKYTYIMDTLLQELASGFKCSLWLNLPARIDNIEFIFDKTFD